MSRYLLAGQYRHYHGEAVNPRYLSAYERWRRWVLAGLTNLAWQLERGRPPLAGVRWRRGCAYPRSAAPSRRGCTRSGWVPPLASQPSGPCRSATAAGFFRRPPLRARALTPVLPSVSHTAAPQVRPPLAARGRLCAQAAADAPAPGGGRRVAGQPVAPRWGGAGAAPGRPLRILHQGPPWAGSAPGGRRQGRPSACVHHRGLPRRGGMRSWWRQGGACARPALPPCDAPGSAGGGGGWSCASAFPVPLAPPRTPPPSSFLCPHRHLAAILRAPAHPFFAAPAHRTAVVGAAGPAGGAALQALRGRGRAAGFAAARAAAVAALAALAAAVAALVVAARLICFSYCCYVFFDLYFDSPGNSACLSRV